MERILLFPLNEDTEVLIQNAGKSTEYQVMAVSSYREDAKRLEKLQRKSSLYYSVNFNSCLQMVDIVIFAENTMGHGYSGYKERVKEALNMEKKIFIGASLLKRLGVDPQKENVHILQKEELPKKLDDTRLKDIRLPILAVMSEGENCDKFKLQAKIKVIVEKKEYKVLSVCSNILGKFMDMEILPGFLFSEQISLQVKIEAFNNWIYKLQEKSEADIIVMGCPGGILEFEEYESNHYGEIPFAMLKAVIADKGILTIYRNCKQDESSMKGLSNFCQMRYNTTVEDFVISQRFFRTDHEQKKIKYYSIEEQVVLDYTVEELEQRKLSPIEDDEKIERQIDQIIKEFENNFLAI